MSKRRPGSRRTRQQQHDDADDAFVAGILDFSNWAKQNQQLLTIAGVLLTIVIAGAVYYRSYRKQLFDQAAQQLEVIHQSVSINDTEGAKIDLATFLDRFGSTPYEGEARLLLGELYLDDGESQQAIAVLEPLGGSPSAPIEFQGAALLAVAYEQERRWDDAEATYLKIASGSDLKFQVRDALASAARIRGSRGDTDGAIELYERVLADLDDNAPERGTYEMRIEELRDAASDTQ